MIIRIRPGRTKVALEVALYSAVSMALSAGARLGPYEILSLLGAGGMGEVYQARDAKLNRDVALKILPESLAGDPERLARFRREAQMLAALNHPNIAHIHGFEDSGATHAIVMELVSGVTLAEMTSLPPADLVPIARQIAEALEAAHEQGIIHRDLKPANVKVRPDGTVKVLDFGLAKAMDSAYPGSENPGLHGDGANSPTLSARATQMGMILGTAAYMAPEQARGKPLDKRADIWAFGVVVYEILTGERAFKGEDVSDTLAAVLRQEIDWKALPASTPPRLRRLLERCLDRDVKTRLRDIGEARVELARLESSAADPADAVPSIAATPNPRRALPWIAVGLIAGLVIATAAAWAIVHSAPEPKTQPMRFAFVPSAALPISTNTSDRVLAISPDGTHVAYSAAFREGFFGGLVVRAIDRLDAEPLSGIVGVRAPFFSPDGKWIGFFQAAEIKKVSITGGPAIPVCRVAGAPRGASWGPDDTIVFATADSSSGLFTVPAGGGEPKMITKPDGTRGEGDHQHPSVLPGGRAILYTITSTRGQRIENAVESAQVAVLDLNSGVQKTLIRGGSQAEYVEPFDEAQGRPSGGGPGYLIYAAAGTLRAVRFDPRRLEVRGDPVPVVEQVSAGATGAAEFSVSRAGTLVYLPGGLSDEVASVRSLVWVDRNGKESPIVAAPRRAYNSLRLSPDGTRLAVEISDQEQDIWVWQLDRDTFTRFTFDPGRDSFPVWTPDSRHIVFRSAGSTTLNLFWRNADGTGEIERLTSADHTQTPTSFSPDGGSLLVNDANGSGTSEQDISLLTMDGKRPIAPLIKTSFDERNGEISPDGHWVVYESSESRPSQIWVRPFPDVNGGRWQISPVGGGSQPMWAPNGRELFYVSNDALYSVRIQTTPSFSWGKPVRLFDARNIPGLGNGRFIDISRDGQRFVMIKEPPRADPGPAPPPVNMVVVLNWLEELKARVAIK